MRLRRAVDPVFVLTFVFGLVLTGCGGSGGGNTNQGPDTTATTTTLVVSPTTNVTTATPVTLTATVSSLGGSRTPTGTVTFLDSGTSIGTASLASGVATLTIAAPTAGSHSFTASYGGATAFQTSTSTAVALTVGSPAAATTTALVVAPTTNVTTSTPVTLTATVSSTAGTPPGMVTFLDGTTAVGTGTLSGGVAILTLSTLTAGSHSFTASYAGNTSFAASTSAAVALTVTTPPATTTTALVVAPTTNVTTSTPVTLTATVSSTGGTPAGTVTFLDGTTAVGTGTLSGGVATLTLSTLTAGSHSFTASYAGNTSFAASTSAAVSLTVTSPPATTTTALTIAPTTNVTTATPVTLTATVSSTGGTPTGGVTFLDGTTSVGTGSLTAGVATLTLSTLTAGTHSFTASYAGTTGFAASTSSAVSLTVTSAGGIDAHATFSFTTANQTIVGFGGAEAFYANYLDSHPNESQIMTALFDPVNGLGITFLRLANNYYLYNGSNPSTFDTDDAKIVTGATTALGTAPTILMSSWTPPASLKSNNSVNGCTGETDGNCTSGFGTLAQVGGAYNYAGFGQFWLSSLQAYAGLGVVPNYISIQNEPDFPATYVACLFNPTEAPANLYNYTSPQSFASYGKAFDATYQAINGGGLTSVPKMIGPESFSLYNVQALLTEVPTNELAVVAHHLYNVSSYGGSPAGQVGPMTTLETDYSAEMKFETEYYQTPGFYNAIDIHNALTVANDNVYLYWALAWPSTLDTAKDQASDQQGLLYIDNPFNPSSTWAFPQGWTYNDAYYAMKHYSYYIRPGYVRYDATVDNTDELVSVYQSPDTNTTVIVALNQSTTATDVLALDLSSITYTTSAMYRSTFSQPISTGERWDSLGAYDATNGITLGPQSAVTVILTK